MLVKLENIVCKRRTLVLEHKLKNFGSRTLVFEHCFNKIDSITFVRIISLRLLVLKHLLINICSRTLFLDYWFKNTDSTKLVLEQRFKNFTLLINLITKLGTSQISKRYFCTKGQFSTRVKNI